MPDIFFFDKPKPSKIMEYCEALDKGDIQTLADILERAQYDTDLWIGISLMHKVFDHKQPFAPQLQELREEAGK